MCSLVYSQSKLPTPHIYSNQPAACFILRNFPAPCILLPPANSGPKSSWWIPLWQSALHVLHQWFFTRVRTTRIIHDVKLCHASSYTNTVYSYIHVLNLKKESIFFFKLRKVGWVHVWNLWGSISLEGLRPILLYPNLPAFNGGVTNCY